MVLQEEKMSSEEVSENKSEHILIVDDSEINRMMLREMRKTILKFPGGGRRLGLHSIIENEKPIFLSLILPRHCHAGYERL